MGQNAVITELYKKTAEVKVRASPCRHRAPRLQFLGWPLSWPVPATCACPCPQAKAVQEYVQLLLDNGQKFLVFAVSCPGWR